MQSPKIWKAGLYVRLSKEDVERGNNESASIANQREILKEFLRLHTDILCVETYEDDGVSGTTFDRPGFLRLKADIDSGKIDCVIVKDLSRFGRNYAESGRLLDDFFARKSVRFIAVNNGIDTLGDGMNAAARFLTIGMSNLMNESYVASTSVNIRGTLNNHRRQGKFIGAFACYGYKKSPGDNHKLIIDEEAAEVVRFIYREFIGGKSLIGITKELNALGIPNPTLYKQQKGFNFHSRGDNDGLWSDRTVRRILQNQMYIGNMVQGVNRTVSYKVHECRAVPSEDWIVVENTHEPIIKKELFDMAQSLFGRGIRSSPITKSTDLFSGLVYCADCGKAMCLKTNRHDYGVYRYYKCSTKQKKLSTACGNHTVRADKLEKAVLWYLKRIVALAADYDEIALQLKQNKQASSENSLVNTLAAQKKEREQYILMVDNLYPSWQKGFLSDDEYLRQKEALNKKLSQIEEIIAKLKELTAQQDEKRENPELLAAYYLKNKEIGRLTRPLLLGLVEKIYAHEDGSVTVRLKCRDVFAENSAQDVA